MSSTSSEQRLFRAVVERDRSYDGTFVFAVRTTGVFCRPGCASRAPRRDNVRFFRDAQAAERAGFRACRRCRPTDPAGARAAWVDELVRRVETSPTRIDARALRAAGISPQRATRWFQEHFGMSFQAYQRARRIARSLPSLFDGEPVAELANRSGFESESGFRDAFARLFGAPPARAAKTNSPVHVDWIATPLGSVLAAATDQGLCLLEFTDRRALQAQVATLSKRMHAPLVPGTHALIERTREQLAQYFAGERRTFDLALHAPGTEFQERVWSALRRIPCGETRSYAELAREIGSPSAVRAVARANALNRIAILIPCHRVIGSDGSLTGYAAGLARKQRLLELERSMMARGK